MQEHQVIAEPKDAPEPRIPSQLKTRTELSVVPERVNTPKLKALPETVQFDTLKQVERPENHAYAMDAITQSTRQPFVTQLPEPTMSVFSPHWNNDGASTTESAPDASLFSRFAGIGRILPGMSFSTQPPVIRELASPAAPINVAMAAEDRAKLAEVQEQLSSVHAELQKLPAGLSAAVAEHSVPAPPAPAAPDPEAKYLLHDIDDAVKRIEDQGERNAQGLSGIHAKVDALMSLKKSEVAAPLGGTAGLSSISGLPGGSDPTAVDASLIIGKLEEMRSELKSDLPMLTRKLEDMLAQNRRSQEAIQAVALPDIGALSGNQSVIEGGAILDQDALHAKLDEMLSTIRLQTSTRIDEEKQDVSDEPNPMVRVSSICR